jgi:hypothetical protein
VALPVGIFILAFLPRSRRCARSGNDGRPEAILLAGLIRISGIEVLTPPIRNLTISETPERADQVSALSKGGAARLAEVSANTSKSVASTVTSARRRKFRVTPDSPAVWKTLTGNDDLAGCKHTA